MNSHDLIQEGELRRDVGMARAIKRRPLHVLKGELAMLDRLLAEPGSPITTDVIPEDARLPYGGGGKWVGSVALRLILAGIIIEVGVARSIRPSRHRGRTGLYALADATKAHQRRESLRRMIASLEENPADITLF